MRIFWSLSVAFLLAFATYGAAAAQATADGKTADTAIGLTNEQPVSGSIAGSASGSYAYYWLDYPGDGRTGMLTMGYTPANPALGSGLWITVWQGNVSLGTIDGNGGATLGTTTLSFFSNKASRLLVQISNYVPGSNANYTLTLTGVPSAVAPASAPAVVQPAPAAAAPPASTPPAAGEMSATPDNAPLLGPNGAHGSLTGTQQGAFEYAQVPYAGDGSTQEIVFTYNPTDAPLANAIGIQLWQGNVSLGTINGVSSTPGTAKLSFFSNKPGPILLQAYNYFPGRSVDFQISMDTPPKG